MPARTGDEFLRGLKDDREVWVGGERVRDVAACPAFAGAARSVAALFDLQHEAATVCLMPDPETGEPINVSHLIPRSPTRTTNVVEFYYPEEIVHFEREFIEAQQAAYVETALEDNEICLRMDRGRRALWQQGLDDAGPYQSPMEDTMVHFHEWVRKGLAR